FLRGRIKHTWGRERGDAGIARNMPAHFAVVTIDGDDCALGLAIVRDVNEIIDYDRRLAKAVLFFERTDIATPYFFSVMRQSYEYHTATLEPHEIQAFGIYCGRTGRVAIQSIH